MVVYGWISKVLSRLYTNIKVKKKKFVQTYWLQLIINKNIMTVAYL